MQEDSRTDIGRFLSLDRKRSGTEPILTSRTETRIVALKTWWSTSVKVDTPVFRGSSALERGKMKSKGKANLSEHLCGDDETAEVVLRTIISVDQLSVYGAVADMCDELAWRISACSECTGKLVAQNNSDTMVMPTELSTKRLRPMKRCKDFAARLWTKIRKSSRSSSIDQTVLQCRYREDCGEGTVFHDPRRCETWQIGRLMTRENFTSRERSIQRGRMDPWEHEDRSSAEGSSQLPSRPIRNWDQNQPFIWRRISFLAGLW